MNNRSKVDKAREKYFSATESSRKKSLSYIELDEAYLQNTVNKVDTSLMILPYQNVDIEFTDDINTALVHLQSQGVNLSDFVGNCIKYSIKHLMIKEKPTSTEEVINENPDIAGNEAYIYLENHIDEWYSVKELAQKLSLAEQAVRYILRKALTSGYIKNKTVYMWKQDGGVIYVNMFASINTKKLPTLEYLKKFLKMYGCVAFGVGYKKMDRDILRILDNTGLLRSSVKIKKVSKKENLLKSKLRELVNSLLGS